jgi:hypothetical protein
MKRKLLLLVVVSLCATGLSDNITSTKCPVLQRVLSEMEVRTGRSAVYWVQFADRIALHESGNRNIPQYNDGPASGYYQIEDRTLSVALNRLRAVIGDCDFPVYSRAMEYTKEEQMALMLAYLQQHPSTRMSTDTVYDIWAKGWHTRPSVQDKLRWERDSRRLGARDY